MGYNMLLITLNLLVAVLGDEGKVGSTSNNCGSGTLSFSPKGVIYSHKGFANGERYGPMECFWMVQVHPGMQVHLEPIHFELAGASPSCDKDYLVVYEAKSGNATSVEEISKGENEKQRLCGTKPFTVISDSNRLLLKLHTSSVEKYSGFKLMYSSLLKGEVKSGACNPEHAWECPGERNSTRQSLRAETSPEPQEDDDWGRIVNGQPARKGAWPFIISLRWSGNGGHVCGGSLINAQWVMTAAHCVKPMPNPSQWFVDVGRYNKDQGGPEVKRHRVVKVQMYPAYDPNRIVNDLALLQLDKPVDLTSGNVKLAPIVRDPGVANMLTANTQCIVAGWGDTKGTGSNSVLRQATVPIIDFNLCHSWYSTLTPASFCAGYQQGGIDACQGDSGGPILCRVGGQTLQVGVVSWGSECAKPNQPGVYTNLAKFVNWYAGLLH